MSNRYDGNERKQTSLPPLLNELTAQQSQAAQSLAEFVRSGAQPPKGTLAIAQTNPETVVGEMLLSEGILIGEPDVHNRIDRVLGGLGLNEVSEQAS
jgi:hypothetical protein